jgi:hypothetical protein
MMFKMLLVVFTILSLPSQNFISRLIFICIYVAGTKRSGASLPAPGPTYSVPHLNIPLKKINNTLDQSPFLKANGSSTS